MKLSVVIPTCNRIDALRACLRHLQPDTQTLPCQNYELIVSDDSKGRPVAAILQHEFPDVVWIAGPRRGPAANRNTGAAHASGEVLVFLDDDCLPQPALLATYAAAFAEQPLYAAEGCISADRQLKRMDEDAPVNESGNCFWSCNIAMRKDFFHYIGRFDERFPYAAMEDVELRERILQSGTRIVFLKEASVVHPLRPMKGWASLRRSAESHGIYILLPTCTLPRPSYLAAAWHTVRLVKRKFLPRLIQTKGRGVWRYSQTLALPFWSTWHMKKALRQKSGLRHAHE